jgi:hypothetical protein
MDPAAPRHALSAKRAVTLLTSTLLTALACLALKRMWRRIYLQTVSVRAIIGFLNDLFRSRSREFAHTLDILTAEGNPVTSDK